jgi:NADH dehydrogenase [ubiquinone] 1 alpha subcomplex assembly factor 7
LTADVNFADVKKILEDNDRLITFGPIEQGKFLLSMGAETRLKFLIDNCDKNDDSVKESLKSGLDMLVKPEKMGLRFKFLSMFPSVLKDHLSKFPVGGF